MSQVISVNIARSAETPPGHRVVSGIGKRPVDGTVQVVQPGPKGHGGSGLVGDVICNLVSHGGDDQAVYAYAREDLDWWGAELGRELPAGLFGENLTTRGVNISQSLIGEQWLIGGALLLQVTDPRVPCSKFAAVVGEPRWVRRFTERAAPGTYLRVLRPGSVRAGDKIVVVERPNHSVTVSTAFRALTLEPELMGLLDGVESFSAETRDRIAHRLTSSLAD